MTKKSQDELQNSFQPINSRPKQPQSTVNPSLPQQSNKILKETRDFIAEKKRASIGKFPQNLNVCFY